MVSLVRTPSPKFCEYIRLQPSEQSLIKYESSSVWSDHSSIRMSELLSSCCPRALRQVQTFLCILIIFSVSTTRGKSYCNPFFFFNPGEHICKLMHTSQKPTLQLSIYFAYTLSAISNPSRLPNSVERDCLLCFIKQKAQDTQLRASSAIVLSMNHSTGQMASSLAQQNQVYVPLKLYVIKFQSI